MSALALAFALAAYSSAPAQAASVGTRCDGTPSCAYRLLVIVDEREERNDITVSRPSETEVRVIDRTSTLDARGGCARVTEFEVRCDLIGFPPQPVSADRTVSARLAEGDDRLEISDFPRGHFADGGPGNDRIEVEGRGSEIHGGDGDDSLVGGSGGDLIEGGTGDDALSGGAGNDYLWGEEERSRRFTGYRPEPSDDSVDGGPGLDVMSYDERAAPVRADLEATSGGQEGENDRLIGIEALAGGSGNDELRGTSEANTLDGGRGQDLLDGRSGDDSLEEGEEVLGGEGDDSVSSNGGLLSVSCGGGLDRIKLVFVSRATSIAPDCERSDLALATYFNRGFPEPYTSLGVSVRTGAALGRPPTRPFVRATLACRKDSYSGRGPCRLAVSMRRVGGPSRRVARAATEISPGRTGSLPVSLSPGGRRLLARDRVVPVQVDVSMSRRTGRRTRARLTTSYLTEIRAPGGPAGP